MGYLDQMWADAEDFKSDKLSIEAYAARYGQSFGGGSAGLKAALSSLMPNQIYNPWIGAWQPYSSTIRDIVNREGYKLRVRYQGLPTQMELERRFGESFKDFIFKNFYTEFSGSTGEPTRDYLEKIKNWFGNQDWQYELKDADKKHYLTLAEIRIKLFSQSAGAVDELRSSFLDYAPNGPRILNNERGTADGTVINPGIPGTQIIFLELPQNYFIGVIAEFNYIPHN